MVKEANVLQSDTSMVKRRPGSKISNGVHVTNPRLLPKLNCFHFSQLGCCNNDDAHGNLY